MSTAQVRAGPPPGRWDQSGGRFFRRSTAGPAGYGGIPGGLWRPAAQEVRIYPAQHGFAVSDNPTYDTGADARHWAALEQLYRARLQG